MNDIDWMSTEVVDPCGFFFPSSVEPSSPGQICLSRASSFSELNGGFSSGAAIPTDDIWKKFDFDMESSKDGGTSGSDAGGDGIFEPTCNASPSTFELYWTPKEQFKEIRHHDCMWAGLCGSKDHKNADSCILAYEGTKPSPLAGSLLSTDVKPSGIVSSSGCHQHNNNSNTTTVVPHNNNTTSTQHTNESLHNSENNTIYRTTLTNGTQITTAFKNRTNLSTSVSRNEKPSNGNVSASFVSNAVKVFINNSDKKVSSGGSCASTTSTRCDSQINIVSSSSSSSSSSCLSSSLGGGGGGGGSSSCDTNLSMFRHLSSSNDSLSNDIDVHLMPISEVTGQITRTLSTIQSNPPVVDLDCANREHNYGLMPLPTPVPPAPASSGLATSGAKPAVASSSGLFQSCEFSLKKQEFKEELMELTSDEEDYDDDDEEEEEEEEEEEDGGLLRHRRANRRAGVGSSSAGGGGSTTVYMSPTSSTCSGKFDYGVQQTISKYIKTEDLGVQTPSDSDEEVDVVSVHDIDLYEKCKRTLITPPQSVLTSRSTTPNHTSHPSSVSKHLPSSSTSASTSYHHHHTVGGGSSSSSKHHHQVKRSIKSTLPTNPYDNLDSYEELQRNVAKVIKKSTNSKKQSRGRKPAKKKSNKSSGGANNSSSGTTYLNKSQCKNGSFSKSLNGNKVSGHKQRRDYDEYKQQYLSEFTTAAQNGKLHEVKKKSYRIDLLPEKRKFHNNMERKRRVDLRNLFEELRELLPSLQNKKRAPKVQILNEAESLCNDLSYRSTVLSRQWDELKREQLRLKSAIAPLRCMFFEKNVSNYLNN